MEAKERLALEIVERYHGKDKALRAKEYFDRVIRKKELPEEIPVYEIKDGEELWLPKILKDSGLVKSTSEARRLIIQGAVDVDGRTVKDPEQKFPPGDHLIRIGKRRFLRIRKGR